MVEWASTTMHDDQKTRAESVQELDSLRRRVSELEQVEEALKRSEKQFKELFENTVVGVYRATPDGRIIMANPALVRMLGYSSFEGLSRRNLEKGGFAPQYPRSIFKDLIEKQGKVIGLESAWLKRDGTTLFISENARVICDECGKTLYYEGIVQDITERKKAEEVLRESEQRYRDIFNGVTDAILILDLEDYIVDANPEAFKMFGYSREEMIGLAAHRLVHPDYRRKLEELRNEIEAKGRIHFEAVNLRKDGTPLNVAVRGTMFAHNGKKHFLVTLCDITKRKRAEEAWSKVNKCFLSFGPNPDDNIYKIVETAGFVLQGTWALYNKEEGALLCARAGWNIPEDFKREDTKVGRICFDVISRNRDEPFVVNNLDKTHYARSDSNVVKYGLKTYVGCAVKTDTKAIGSLCVVYREDKTVGSDELKILSILAKALGVEEGRKGAEEALRESQQQKQAILDSIPDIAWLKDKQSRYIAANEALCKAFGVKLEDLVGKTDFDISPEDLARTYRADDEEVVKSGKRKRVEEQWGRKNGKRIWIETIKTPIYNDRGQVVGTSGIARDISERKRAEEELRAFEERFSGLAERSFDLIFMTDAQGYLTYVSDASEKILDYKPGEMIGTHFKNYLIESEIPRVSQRFAENIRGENLGVLQMEAMRKDGSGVLIELNSAPIVKDGETIGIQGIIRDITERKRVEQAMRQSEEKYRTLYETTQDGIAGGPMDGRILECNQAFADMLGYSKEELANLTYQQLTPKRWHQMEAEIVQEQILKRGYSDEYEKEYIKKDGTVFPISARVWLRKDKDGKAVGMWGIVRDITERKKAEEALQESEERLRVALSAAQMGTWRWDPVTNQDTRDASLNLILGLEAVESTQPVEDFLHFVHPEDRDMVDEEIQRAIHERRTYLAEFRIIRPDGTVRWLRDQGKPLCDENGRVSCLTGAVIDITERKKAEEEIRRLSSAVEQSIDGIAVAIGNLEPRLVYVNNAFARMHAYTPKDMIGMPLTKLHSKKQMREHESSINQIKAHGSWEGEIGRIRRDGKAFTAYMSVTLLKDDQGKPTGILAVARDISESKRREEELNIYRENMVQAEELAAVGTLSATLAHELTQPLTVIGLAIGNSLAELEKMSCPGTVVEDLKEGLSEISSITSMVERFRNFAKMSTKRTVSEVDFKAIAERIVKLLDESAWRAKVTLQVKGMDELPLVYSSERDLEQLFFSLIENAIQAADGKKKRRVIISGAVRDDHIELQFSDNCGGIARKNLDRIFKPFFTTKHGAGRTGLGLCVVERIVSQFGGKVRVESKLGKGSTFFVTLPMNRGER